MALITDYTSLKDALAAFQDRSDVPADQAIQLAEARLNRILKVVEINSTLTGVASSREIDVSTLNVISPVSLFLNDTNTRREYELVPKPDGQFAYGETTGFPSTWAYANDTITFDVPLDQAYTFRFHHTGRFALSDANPTNELLTNNPDIYLCAAIVWGGLFVADDAAVSRYAQPLQAFISEQKLIEEQARRGKLTVDPALSTHRGYSYRGFYGW